jgi:uncharacterized BrkB/YihY/UPF0761 family membrane protein
MKPSGKDVLLLSLGLLPAVVVVFLAFVLVPGCIAVYAPVANQLSTQAKFVFSFYPLCIALPASVVCVWLFWRNRQHRGWVAASFGVLGSIALFCLGCWAIYQPQLVVELIRRSGS